MTRKYLWHIKVKASYSSFFFFFFYHLTRFTTYNRFQKSYTFFSPPFPSVPQNINLDHCETLSLQTPAETANCWTRGHLASTAAVGFYLVFYRSLVSLNRVTFWIGPLCTLFIKKWSLPWLVMLAFFPKKKAFKLDAAYYWMQVGKLRGEKSIAGPFNKIGTFLMTRLNHMLWVKLLMDHLYYNSSYYRFCLLQSFIKPYNGKFFLPVKSSKASATYLVPLYRKILLF